MIRATKVGPGTINWAENMGPSAKADLGFEPRFTDSESVVLTAIRIRHGDRCQEVGFM